MVSLWGPGRIPLLFFFDIVLSTIGGDGPLFIGTTSFEFDTSLSPHPVPSLGHPPLPSMT